MSEKPHSIRLFRLFSFSESESTKNNRKAFEEASMEPTITLSVFLGKSSSVKLPCQQLTFEKTSKPLTL